MALPKDKSNWRTWATLGFTLLLLLNVGLCAAAVGMAIRGDGRPWTIFGDDSPPALRLAVFLVGLAAAWICGRKMLEVLVLGEVEVAEAVTAAIGVSVYFLVFFIGLCFAGSLPWLILLVLLLFALVLTVPVFWRLVGAALTGIIVLFCLVAGAAVVYALASRILLS